MSYGFNELYQKIVKTFGNIQIDLRKDTLYTAFSSEVILTASWREENGECVIRLNLQTANQEHQNSIENIPVSFIDEEENIYTEFLNSEGKLSMRIPKKNYHIRFWKLYEREIDEIYDRMEEKHERESIKPVYENNYANYNAHSLASAYKKPGKKEYNGEKSGENRSYIKIGTDLYSFGDIKSGEKQDKIKKLQKIMKKSEKETQYKIYELKEEDKLWEIQ